MKFPLALCLSLSLTPALFVEPASAAAPPVIDLWPGPPPGTRPAQDVPQQGGDKTWMTNISHPTLEIHLAAGARQAATAVVICPGGGYAGLAYHHEGVQVAEWFNRAGVSAIVLKYRTPNASLMSDRSAGPLQDVQEAIRTVRRRSREWNVNPSRIGVMGFSAGGHLAASASNLYDLAVNPSADATSARPDFSILIYPVISMDPEFTHGGSRENLLGTNPAPDLVRRFSMELQVDGKTPPAFLVHSIDDTVVPVENSLRYLAAMKAHAVPVEFHAYPTGGHGYGLGQTPESPKQWPDALRAWLLSRRLIDG